MLCRVFTIAWMTREDGKFVLGRILVKRVVAVFTDRGAGRAGRRGVSGWRCRRTKYLCR